MNAERRNHASRTQARPAGPAEAEERRRRAQALWERPPDDGRTDKERERDLDLDAYTQAAAMYDTSGGQ